MVIVLQLDINSLDLGLFVGWLTQKLIADILPSKGQ